MAQKLIAILLLLAVPVLADVPSGLAVGDWAPAHNPQHVTGPDADTTVCPV